MKINERAPGLFSVQRGDGWKKNIVDTGTNSGRGKEKNIGEKGLRVVFTKNRLSRRRRTDMQSKMAEKVKAEMMWREEKVRQEVVSRIAS